MSYDPYPSYQAPPPPPPPPPSPSPSPSPSPGRRVAPPGEHFPLPGGHVPAYGEYFPPPGGQFPPPGARFPGPGGQLPAHDEVFHPFDAQPAPRRHAVDLEPLRAAYRGQRRVAGLTLLGFFALYVLLTVFAPSLADARPGGGLSLGLLLALLQLPLTMLALFAHEHTARRRVDPLVDRVRAPRGEAS
ncbi:DUF485 domain-containing protein [Streptomyces abyssomicinicus]|uniref:DUF485 domain-containing protein n=1 Tax=Streptomyces abyssomicinicus TaxID=574929 RepID=UPI00159D4E6F|nr:DUF485 domain-containing protein [Streptomyces abyssomicinicus]